MLFSNQTVQQAGDDLTAICHGLSYEAGWWLAPRDDSGGRSNVVTLITLPSSPMEKFVAAAFIGQKLALIHSEVSEALEGARKNKMDEHLSHRQSIEVELADAVIRIFDLAGALGLDLGGAMVEKLRFNQQREDHKLEVREQSGGKAF